MRGAAAAGLLLLRASLAAAGDPVPGGLPPGEELKTIHVAAGFRVELVACEPLVADPVSIAWDARGRLWVAEMPDYPSGPAGGRVRWLEDTDGDGLPDHGVVFADGLPWPTSVLAHQRGVLVSAAPDILYLEDTDGDGRADMRRVVLTGFGLGTTQLRVNGLQRGIDGRIYGANGRSGGSIRRPEDPVEKAVSIERRDFRFDPDTFAPEAIAGPSQFGFAFDEWGHRFLSWNTIHIREELLSPHDLERHPFLTRTETVASISDHGDPARVFPLAPPPRTFNDEPTDHFNASCGLTIECGGIFPPSHAGNAFVCEPLTGIVHRDVLEPGPGPALVAKRGEEGEEFLASTDPWFHPVNCRSGPDGALYVVDFYREMVEHPEYVHDAKVREKTDFALGKGHGRIYRVVPTHRDPIKVPRMDIASTGALAEMLGSPNGRVRETAQRLILEQRDPATVNALRRVENPASPFLALSLWTLHALGKLEPQRIGDGLGAGPRLRETILRIARERPEYLAVLRERLPALAIDADPGVRLQAVLAVGDLRDASYDGVAAAAMAAAVMRGVEDPWINEAMVSRLRGREVEFLSIFFGSRRKGPTEGELDRFRGTFREAASLAGASGDAVAESSILAMAASRIDARKKDEALLLAEGLASGLERSKQRAIGPAWERLFDVAMETALDAAQDTTTRGVAISLLGSAQWSGAGAVLRNLFEPHVELSLQIPAARALARQESPEATALLLDAWTTATPSLRSAILDGFSRRPERLAKLADAIEAGAVGARDIDPAHREALLRAAYARDRTRLEGLLARGGKVSGDRAAVVERYRAGAPASGDALKGAAAFAARCATCHRFAGAGHAVGPDLSGIGKKTRDELLVSILDPNRSTVPGYTAYVVELEDGQVWSGVLVGETSQAITLRRPDGIEDGISRASIRLIASTGLSLMPEGLEATLGPTDMGDLLQYLRTGEAKKP